MIQAEVWDEMITNYMVTVGVYEMLKLQRMLAG